MNRVERDRRCYERVPVVGAAAVLEFDYLGLVYELDNVSLGGARLGGARRPPPTAFDILLRVADRYMERRARHVWDNHNGHLGIEFEGPAVQGVLEWPDALQMQHHLWARQEPTQLNRGAIIVLEDDMLSASILSRYLTVLGREPRLASTPLEAIDMIERATTPVEGIFIAPRLSGCSGLDLANFFASAYPEVKRVLLNTREAGQDLLSGAHKVLARPWSLASVKDTVDGLGGGLLPHIRNPETLRAAAALS